MKNSIATVTNSLREELNITKPLLDSIALNFQRQIEKGLSGTSCFKMINSYLDIPTGMEKGIFAALDFGGTNIRAVMVELLGNSRYRILKSNSVRLRPLQEGDIDYTASKTTGPQLFDYIASLIESLHIDKKIFIGHTFSFPTKQYSLNQAMLVCWTKEIETSQVEGEDVNRLLKEALERRKLPVVPIAVINDTVGTLVAGGYYYSDAAIGSILGTGHNTCYLERVNGSGTIINLESGNFSDLLFSRYDIELDLESSRPGEQRLEKMVSGYYIGEIFRLVCLKLISDGILLPRLTKLTFDQRNLISAYDLSMILSDNSANLERVRDWLGKMITCQITDFDVKLIRAVAVLIVERSAKLAAASYIGILQHIDPELKNNHTIAIDGSLFEKMPGYATIIQNCLELLFTDKSGRVRIQLVKDGSGIGAAIAAAVAAKELK